MSGLALTGELCVRHGVAMPISSSMEEHTSHPIPPSPPIHRPSHCPPSLPRPSLAHLHTTRPTPPHPLGHRSIDPSSRLPARPPSRLLPAEPRHCFPDQVQPRGPGGRGLAGGHQLAAIAAGDTPSRPSTRVVSRAHRARGGGRRASMDRMAWHGMAWHGQRARATGRRQRVILLPMPAAASCLAGRSESF